MFNYLTQKNNVVLSAYHFQKDIESRLFIANLTLLEMEVLSEILNHSLVIPIKQFSQQVNIPLLQLMLILEKFKSTKLLKMEGETIIINKEIRKYFEHLMIKFNHHFEPGLDYLYSLLQKISIPTLLQWYPISKATDDIFQSILDKFLMTPKIYERYLKEIEFADPKIHQIINNVFSAPDTTISVKALMTSCQTSHEKMEEYLLFLEYNFICCLSYRKTETEWEEIVTPFWEWHQYLRFKKTIAPRRIVDMEQIVRSHPEDFGFVCDMSKILHFLQTKPLPVEPFKEGYTLKSKEGSKCLPNAVPQYQKKLIDKLLIQGLIEIAQDRIYALEEAEEWLKKSDEEKALTLSRHPVQVEKELKYLAKGGWYYVEDFLKGFTGSLGSKNAFKLKQKGKKWEYAFPSYTAQELEMIKTTLCDRLFEAGVVATGIHQDKLCFSVTSFGRSLLDD